MTCRVPKFVFAILTSPVGTADFENLLTADFPALRHLGLLLQAGDEWAKLASVLEQLHARRLQHIVLYNVPTRTQTPSGTPGSAMDDPLLVEDRGLELLEPVFEGDSMKALESVEFVVDHDSERGDWDPGDRGRVSALERHALSVIERTLPKFRARGTLAVRCRCQCVVVPLVSMPLSSER